MKQPDGRIMHAEVGIGDSVVMMGEPVDESKTMPGVIHLYVDDTDAAYTRALRADATSLRDPSGNVWWIATHKEDLSPQELARRADAFVKQQARS